MRLCYGALLTVVALSTVTATSTTQEIPPPFGDCSHPLSSYWVWNAVEKCLESGDTPEASKLYNSGDLDKLRVFFADYCGQRTVTIRDCLREQQTKFETCQNEKRVKLFEMFRHVIETLFDVGCVEGGEKLATVFQGLLRLVWNDATDWKEINKCMPSIPVVFRAVISAQVDLSSTMYILYQELPKFRKCCSKITLEQPFGELANWFMGEMIRAVRCVSPDDGTLVACSSIVASHVRSPTMCDALNRPDVYDSLEAMAAGCFAQMVENDALATDMEIPRDTFEDSCRDTVRDVQCPSEAEVLADMCLHETERKEFGLLVAAMKSALVSACAEDQKPIFEVMYEVYRVNKTSGRHVMRECIDVAKATRLQGGSSAAKNLRFYREAGVFKGCLLEKLGGDRRSVVAAKAVMEEVLRGLMCLHPETGAAVLCTTLTINSADGLYSSAQLTKLYNSGRLLNL